jgi:hypothetical protein
LVGVFVSDKGLFISSELLEKIVYTIWGALHMVDGIGFLTIELYNLLAHFPISLLSYLNFSFYISEYTITVFNPFISSFKMSVN